MAHARKSFSIRDRIDRFSIRGAGELADRVDNVLLLQRYYSEDTDEADVNFSISKARHWDMAEGEVDLWMDLQSLNLLMRNQQAVKVKLKDEIDEEEVQYQA